MKYSLLLMAVASLAHLRISESAMSEAQLKATGKLAKKSCQPKTKATDAQIANLHKGEWNDEPEIKCFAYCLMNMYKLVDKDTGAFNEETAFKQVNVLPAARQEPIIQSVNNCRGSDVGEGKCDRSYQFMKCIYFDNPGNYIGP